MFSFLFFPGTKGFMGEPAVSPTYCPINGAYSFTYSINDGTESGLECKEPTSEIADCPYGFGFNLKFHGCSFGEMDMSFHCLGDWEGSDGQRYVALMDTQATPKNKDGTEVAEGRPRYRCAVSSDKKSIFFSSSNFNGCTADNLKAVINHCSLRQARAPFKYETK